MTTSIRQLPLLIVGSALLATVAGCKKNSATIPSPVLASENFSGSLAVGGESINLFFVDYVYGVTDAGVTVNTLTSAATGAALNVPIGVAFGTYNSFDGSCTRAASATKNNAAVGQESVASGQFTQGQFCVVVFDPGTVPEPANYTMTVRHY